MFCLAAFGPSLDAITEWVHLCVASKLSIPRSAGLPPETSRLSTYLPRCVLVQSSARGCGVSSLLATAGNELKKLQPLAYVLEVNITDVLASSGGLLALIRQIDEAVSSELLENNPILILMDSIDDLSLIDSSESHASGVRELSEFVLRSTRCYDNVWFLLGGHGLPVPRSVLTTCDQTIEVGLPDDAARLALIRHMISQNHLDADEAFLLASTRGFSIGQVLRVFRLAGLLADNTSLDDCSETRSGRNVFSTAVSIVCDSMTSSWAGSKAEFHLGVVCSTRKDHDADERHWPSVGGYASLKRRLTQLVLWPLLHPEKLSSFGITSTKGVLLYGPSGCGKNLFVRDLATLCQVPLLTVKGPEIMSKFVGESEAEVRRVFRRARSQAPCIVFLDEIDTMAAKRSMTGQSGGASGVYERVLSTLLNEMDGIEAGVGVIVIGATTRAGALDAALCRPGRFDELMEVPLPDVESRLDILKVVTSRTPLADTVRLDYLASDECTIGWSGADLKALVAEAALNALRRSMESECVELEDFTAALRMKA